MPQELTVEEARRHLFVVKVRAALTPVILAYVAFMMLVVLVLEYHANPLPATFPLAVAAASAIIGPMWVREAESQLATAHRQWRAKTRARWGLYD